MKLSNFRRFTLADLPTLPNDPQALPAALQGVFEAIFSQLNQILEEVIQGSQGNLTVGDNLNGMLKRLQVEHDVEQEFSVEGEIRGKPAVAKGHTPGYASTDTISFPNETTVRVRFTFDAPVPTGKVDATVFVLGE